MWSRQIVKSNKGTLQQRYLPYKELPILVCGSGQMVSVLAFYSDDPSSNPADAYSFFVKLVFEKIENKQKEAEVGP